MGFTVHCYTGDVFEKLSMLKVDACPPMRRHTCRIEWQVDKVEADDACGSTRKRRASGRLALRRNG